MNKKITLLILFVLTGFKVKGTTIGTATDIDGKFSIKAAGNATLLITSIGYTQQEVLVKNRTSITIMFENNNKQLNEVVVVGYGTRTNRDLTGAISSVKAEQLENENPNNVSDLLKGNVPRIAVGINPSPKGDGDLLIRGKASLQGNTSPLIVLDGVIYSDQLSDINPNDIERIDTLKDASSLAVYGSASAAGVVAITTKKGKTGLPQITFNANTGITQLEKDQKYYQGDAFLNWRANGARASNTNNPAYYYSDPHNLPAGVTLAQFLNGANGHINQNKAYSVSETNIAPLDHVVQ